VFDNQVFIKKMPLAGKFFSGSGLLSFALRINVKQTKIITK
jgi:hypothetical protein